LKIKRSISTSVTILILALVILCGGSIGFMGYMINRNMVINSYATQSMVKAQTIASGINTERFTHIMETGEKDDYWYEIKSFIDRSHEETGVLYLYILFPEYGDEITYFVDAYDLSGEAMDFGETGDSEDFADEMFLAIDTGLSTASGIFDGGEYGVAVAGFAPIINDKGSVIGVVGVEICVSDVLSSVNNFAVITLISVIVAGVLFSLLAMYFARKIIIKPIVALSDFMGEAASTGNIIISRSDAERLNKYMEKKDEIGQLMADCSDFLDHVKRIATDIEILASGDLSQEVELQSNADTIGLSLQKTLQSLNNIFSEINLSAVQVSSGSKQIADGSQALAQGTTEQAASIQRLSSSISEIANKTKDNADKAGRAAALADTIKENAEKGSHQMDEMMAAVKEINEAGQSIGKVIKVIDDIAFQTNILALNASVEAARAGQHGKGFAVVAEEVRNLAAKSAEAAKETNSLIANSIDKAELGSRIAGETASSLEGIVSGINESTQIVSEIAKSSEKQSIDIEEINRGIDQVAQVVQQNSATAQESSAASQQMSGQSAILENLITQFKLKDKNGVPRLM